MLLHQEGYPKSVKQFGQTILHTIICFVNWRTYQIAIETLLPKWSIVLVVMLCHIDRVLVEVAEQRHSQAPTCKCNMQEIFIRSRRKQSSARQTKATQSSLMIIILIFKPSSLLLDIVFAFGSARGTVSVLNSLCFTAINYIGWGLSDSGCD